ncbi:MAG: helix-turn-helix domain-containing protein [Clostridia bacterium]|nr:helix-turn-helix domain-containing protein [Clostridia bacterium]
MKTMKGVALKNKIEVSGLASAFYYRFPQDFYYSGESHSGWEFVYVESGKVSVGADNATYILKRGEMVCHKPFEFHTVKPYEKDAAVIIFCFETDNEYMEYFNNKILSVNQRQKQFLNDIANEARSVFLPKEPLDIVRDGQMDVSPKASDLQQQFIKNTIELLIISLLSADATEKQSRISLYEHFSQRQTLTENIIEYLEENISESINLEDVSKRFSYSLSSIKRIFKEETGSSIISYLNEMRMKKAKEMLRDKRLNIEDIAIKVGFANVYYFSNAFKKRWGVSPSKFRT